MSDLRIAQIGSGGNGSGHLKRFVEAGAQVVGVADPDPAAQARAKEITGCEAIFAHHKEMLEAVRPDGVCVSVPNNLHCELACDALRAGANVLLEKPMDANVENCRPVLEVEKETGKLVMMGFCCRYQPATWWMKDLVASNRLGRISHVRVEDLRRKQPPVEQPPGGRKKTWFSVRSISGGGVFLDLGPHMVDQMLYVLGHPEPVEVSGEVSPKPGARDDPEQVEDFASGIIRFKDGMTMSLLFQKGAFAERSTTKAIDVHGDKGRVSVSAAGTKLFTEDTGYGVEMTPQVPEKSYFAIQTQLFLDWLKKGGPSPAPAKDGYVMQLIVDALYRSAESGRAVTIDVNA